MHPLNALGGQSLPALVHRGPAWWRCRRCRPPPRSGSGSSSCTGTRSGRWARTPCGLRFPLPPSFPAPPADPVHLHSGTVASAAGRCRQLSLLPCACKAPRDWWHAWLELLRARHGARHAIFSPLRLGRPAPPSGRPPGSSLPCGRLPAQHAALVVSQYLVHVKFSRLFGVSVAKPHEAAAHTWHTRASPRGC